MGLGGSSIKSLSASLPSSPLLRFLPIVLISWRSRSVDGGRFAFSVASFALALVAALSEGLASLASSFFGLIDRVGVAKRGGVGRTDRGEVKVAEDPGLLMLVSRSVEGLMRSIWYVLASFLTLLSRHLVGLDGELATVERAELVLCCTLVLRPRSLSSASSP